MGKLATQSFERDHAQSATQKALNFYNANIDDFHRAIQAVTKIELNKNIGAVSVRFLPGDENKFCRVIINTSTKTVDITYDGSDIYISEPAHTQ
ncbi:hypothetical protein [Aliidongia dinghuensis]|uniref:hypothetical protein n=1 Tax=Aliidongia dinghuensis TaxID=1867774 RepID=UPI001667061B|nr:hypothetical protein [Aliidongia dinghuensis]